MTSLLEEADLILAKQKTKKSGAFERDIIKVFKAVYKDFPVSMELIASMFEIDITLPDEDFIATILNESEDGVHYYEINIGNESVNLMQNEATASRDRGTTMETMYCAWAIKFPLVFGYDIYFIPYNDTKNSFACIVIDPNVDDEEESWKRFFRRDISRKFAVDMIVGYKNKLNQ